MKYVSKMEIQGDDDDRCADTLQALSRRWHSILIVKPNSRWPALVWRKSIFRTPARKTDCFRSIRDSWKPFVQSQGNRPYHKAKHSSSPSTAPYPTSDPARDTPPPPIHSRL